jgi:DNA-binding MarR family transcriptional regulator
MNAFHAWLALGRQRADEAASQGREFQAYFQGVAKARYVIRRVFRIVDDQAKQAGLEPLQHQALIQIFGASNSVLKVNHVADRLDIPPAFASRLIRDLEEKGLVTRSPSDHDLRITQVRATDAARQMLAQIDERVHEHVQFFQRNLTDVDRVAAIGVFAFYLGVAPDLRDFERLEASVQAPPQP